MTIGLTTRKRWRMVFLASLCLIGGYIPGGLWFPATSNLGEAVFVAGATFMAYLVQEDLFLAGSFADYLHKSNLAFRQARVAAQRKKQQLEQEQQELENVENGENESGRLVSASEESSGLKTPVKQRSSISAVSTRNPASPGIELSTIKIYEDSVSESIEEGSNALGIALSPSSPTRQAGPTGSKAPRRWTEDE
jgi:hypothetical protein